MVSEAQNLLEKDTLIPKVFITKTDQCEYRSVCPIAKYLIESTVK